MCNLRVIQSANGSGSFSTLYNIQINMETSSHEI